jgi:hypothetical protein
MWHGNGSSLIKESLYYFKACIACGEVESKDRFFLKVSI